MFDLDRWQEIFISLKRNKARSFLTAFGVFWGVFMLIVLIGGGSGLTQMVKKQLSGVATNSCIIWSGRTSEAYKGFKKGRRWNIDTKDVDNIKKTVKTLDEISPILTLWAENENAIRGDKKGTFNVQGSYANYTTINKFNMKYGRYINNLDAENKRKVCVIGSRVYEKLFFAGENPIGQEIRVNGVYYKIIGVGETGGAMSFNGDSKELITVPLTTMQQIHNTGNKIHMFMATAKKNVPVSQLQEDIESILRTRHHISPTDKQAVDGFNLEKTFKQITGLIWGVNILVLIVGLGTLLAGVIGVSNIMIVTVRERTQEIGIRRAIGAKPNTIMTQILSESFVLTAIAGFMGIAFSVLVLQITDLSLAGKSEYMPSFQISFLVAVLAAFTIIILGTLAGLGPAFRAMKIKAIDALRDE